MRISWVPASTIRTGDRTTEGPDLPSGELVYGIGDDGKGPVLYYSDGPREYYDDENVVRMERSTVNSSQTQERALQ